MNQELRIGVIGCGNIAQAHLAGYASISGVKLVGVADIDKGKSLEAAQKFKAKPYQDYRQLLKREDLHGVSVCTPPSSHKKIVIDCLENKVGVLCEKPLAITSREAEQMVIAAQENGVLLLTAFKFRFFPLILKTKEVLEQQELGKILFFRSMVGCPADMKDGWFSKKEFSGGGVLIDNGVHLVDIYRFLLGEVKKVACRLENLVQDLEVEDTASILLEGEKGIFGTILLSWSNFGYSPTLFEIYGREGTLWADWESIRYITYKSKDWVIPELSQENCFKDQCEHFVKCIKGEEKPRVTGQDGLRSLQVIEASYQAAKEAKWITLLC